MVAEIHRQFNTIVGLKEGKEGVKPDYDKCIDIATGGALKELIPAGLMSIIATVVVGIIGGPLAIGGFFAREHRIRVAAGTLHEQRRRVVGQREKSTSNRAKRAARAARPIRPPSSATPSATRSKIPPGLRSTPRSPLSRWSRRFCRAYSSCSRSLDKIWVLF